jgi:paired amphipathic helix protein Sin3a
VNAITRIYGDHGQEILHLLEKNPAKTIPTIFARLKQKGAEFRAARDQLNKRWKDLVEHNYHKSLDHRSFYFRQTDKKNTSTKSLLNELLSAAFQKVRMQAECEQGHSLARTLFRSQGHSFARKDTRSQGHSLDAQT